MIGPKGILIIMLILFISQVETRPNPGAEMESSTAQHGNVDSRPNATQTTTGSGANSPHSQKVSSDSEYKPPRTFNSDSAPNAPKNQRNYPIVATRGSTMQAVNVANQLPKTVLSVSDYSEFITQLKKAILSGRKRLSAAEFIQSKMRNNGPLQPIGQLPSRSRAALKSSLVPMSIPSPSIEKAAVGSAMHKSTPTSTPTRRLTLQEERERVKVQLNMSRAHCPSLEEFIGEQKQVWRQLKAADGVSRGFNLIIEAATDSVSTLTECIANIFWQFNRWINSVDTNVQSAVKKS